jgi:ElaB/YqjD/DUF883 family membrane-anchored ribosome-binding protein
MDTVAKPEPAYAPARQTYDYDRSKEKLLADLKLVVLDVEVLIKEVAAASNERFATLRTGFESKLVEAKGRLLQVKSAAGDKSRHAAEVANAIVTENPWRAAGVCVVVGTIVGFCLGRLPVDGSIKPGD